MRNASLDVVTVGEAMVLPAADEPGPLEAVRRSAWIGTRAVQARGDTESLPRRAQLLAASH